MCPRPTPGENSIAYTRAKKRVEWLARYRFIYLTNSTNSRVRSTHLSHTKPPFSRFFGCRRQKNKNIVVSARGRRTPQAPTLRIFGCVNARKYDFKSSSLYSRSSHAGRQAHGCGVLTAVEWLRPAPGRSHFGVFCGCCRWVPKKTGSERPRPARKKKKPAAAGRAPVLVRGGRQRESSDGRSP